MYRKSIIITILVTIMIPFVFNSCSAKKETLKVYVLDGGSITLNNALHWFTSGDEYDDVETKTLANTLFLIEHSKGRLLWDAGLEDAFADRNPEDVDVSASMGAIVSEKLIDQLDNMGLTPDSIKYLVASHTHWDHVGNANYFKNSTWIVDKNEYEWAFRESANSSLYDSLKTTELIQFEDFHDVFGDGNVVVYSTPGHTPGHMSLYIKLEKSRSILLAGDLYHFSEQREHKIVPPFNTDSLQTTISMDNFEKLAMKLNAQVIIPHEMNDYLALPKYPDYLE